MRNYSEVTTHEEMDALIYSMGDFHDSMTKEIHMINRGGILEDHKMLMCHQFDAQVLIQSQWQPYAIELLFCDVQQISVADALDYASATGAVTQYSEADETPLVTMNFDTAVKISARKLFFKIQPDFLGVKARLKSEVPSAKVLTARLLDGRWRQCSECLESWEDDPDQEYSVCPKCQRLTEIQP